MTPPCDRRIVVVPSPSAGRRWPSGLAVLLGPMTLY